VSAEPQTHVTAVISPSARLAEGVCVGPYAVIGDEVELGKGTQVGAHASIAGPSVFGPNNRIFDHAVLGFDPQDMKYKGERTRLVVGSGNVFREFSTVHRGTAGGTGETIIGNDNVFLAYSHVAHDCRVGSRCVFSNGASLAGHVEVGDGAVLGAFAGAHQFIRIGRYAFVGAYTPIRQDCLPFCKTDGADHPKSFGINRVGLERNGFAPERIKALEQAYRLLARSNLNTTQALERIAGELSGEPDVEILVEFIRSSQRGFHK
jgi:UDP-N-acetylglucosamine acyltransferase